MASRGVPNDELPPPVDALGNVIQADGVKYRANNYTEHDAAHPVVRRI